MAEKVGEIYYSVTLETGQMIQAQREIDRRSRETASSLEAMGGGARAAEQGFRSAGAAAQEAGGRFRDAAGRLREANGQFVGTGSAAASAAGGFRQAALAAGGLGSSLSQVAGAIKMYVSAAYLIEQSDAYTKLNAQLKLATSNSAQLATAQAAVVSIAQEAQVSIAGVGTLYARITSSTKELGISQAQVGAITRSVALSLKVSGATAQEAASATLQLSQAFASGVLRGDEFNSVNEAAPRLMQALADGIGVPVGALRKMAEAGLLTSAMLAETLPKSLTALESEAKQIQTISGAFQQLKNEATLFIGQTSEQSGAVKLLTGSIGLLSDHLTLLAGAMATVAAVRMATYLQAVVGSIYQAVAANRALATANLATAQADAAVTGATAVLTAAREAELRATIASSSGSVALAITVNGLVPAQARAAAAAEAHSIALVALAAAQRAASVTGTVLTGALRLLGGPIGAVTTLLGLGITAWSMWGNSAQDASDKAAQAIDETHDQVIRRLDQQNQKLRERIALAKAGGKAAATQGGPEGERLAGVMGQISAIKNKGGNATTRELLDLIELEDTYKKLNSTIETRLKLEGEIEDIGHAKSAAEWMKKYATETERANAEVAKAKKELGNAFTPDLEKRIREKIDKPDTQGAKKAKHQATQALAAQEYYEGLVAYNKTALEKIDAEEKKALTENQKRRVADGGNAAVYEAAKAEIHRKFSRERAQLEEKTTQEVADLNIQLTTDAEAKIEAVRSEEFRRADAAVKLGTMTHDQAERAKTLAMHSAAQQRMAIAERVAQTTAETAIEATTNELTKIDLIRQESIRRAEAAEKAGTISHAQAEADKARATVQAQTAIRQQMMSVNPLAALKQEYEQKLAIVRLYEQQMAQAGVDATAFAEAKRNELQTQYQQQRLALAESEFALQNNGNKFLMDSLNGLASSASSAITGLITGTMSAQDAMRGLASTVLNEAVGALVQMGVQYLKNALLANSMDAADKARAAANASIYAASVGAQVAGMSAMAAQNAFAATAAIPIVGPGLAPAAAAMAGAASAALGAPAVATAPLAGARQYGGPVSADRLYRVNEKGAPEMFTASNGSQYMLPTTGGQVTAADKVGSSAPQINIVINNTAAGTQATASYDQSTRTVQIAIAEVASQIRSNTGPVWSALRGATNVRGAL